MANQFKAFEIQLIVQRKFLNLHKNLKIMMSFHFLFKFIVSESIIKQSLFLIK